jgi:CheY-like chemotaxis protein
MFSARKILVVDDDPVTRKMLEQVLTGKGHAVISASDGEDALWQFSAAGCGAVFTRLQLHGINGLELAQALHVRQPGLPVAVIADGGAALTQQHAASAGVAELLLEPLSIAQIAQSADRLLPAAYPDSEAQCPTTQGDAATARTVRKARGRLQNMVLFLLAPVFAFFYILAFPVVWLGMVLWSALNPKQELPEPDRQRRYALPPVRAGILKSIATMLAAVLVGVAFSVVGPLLGIGLLFSFAIQAWVRFGAKVIGPDET